MLKLGLAALASPENTDSQGLHKTYMVSDSFTHWSSGGSSPEAIDLAHQH